jgi:lipopolysaccharide export system protein LptA
MLKLNTYAKSVIFIIIFAISFVSFAEEKENKRTPIEIEADNMKYFGDKQMSQFKGNVIVIQDGMKMKSDNMDVFFTKNREVKEIFSYGNVKIEKEDLLALSEKAKIYNIEQKVVLQGNARVWQGENYLEGEKVTLFNDSERLYVDKGADKRVKIIITPQEENSKVGTQGE